MAAAYDTYDYPAYWEGREYEQESEFSALKFLLNKIPKFDNVLEIGAGFGRLTPTYVHRAKKVTLTDPSAKLLSLARETFTDKKVKFIHSKMENLRGKLRGKSIDVIICVRVLHHIEDLDLLIDIVHRLLKKRGYFILEFANKRHFKAVVSEFFKGNFTFAADIFPKDINSKKSLKMNALPFKNYHPDIIKKLLRDNGFDLIEVLSVSNIRSESMKKAFPIETLISIEKELQKPLGRFTLGPSIFILARKRD